MVSDAYGMMLENSGMLDKMAREHTTVLQRLADSIRDILRSINKAVSLEDLKLSQEEKDTFIELRSQLRGMENAMRNALKAVEKSGSQAYNDGNKTQVKHSRKTPGFNNERSLSHDELASVYEYKASESYKLNGLLLAGAKLDDRYIKMRDNLDTALEKLPVHTGKVYRNLVFDDFDGQAGLDDFMSLHHVGVPVNYGAYASSSKTPDGHPAVGEYVVNLEIESATGRDMEGFGNNFEEEVLFGREAWFIPTKITVGADGNPLIVMKEEVVYGTGVHTGRNDRHSGRAGAVQQGAETSEASRGEVRDVRAVQDGNTEVQGASRGHSQRGAERGRALSEVSKENVKYSLKDSDYMKAVNAGDMDTAQRMVYEAAKAAGYTGKGYHGTDTYGFTTVEGSLWLARDRAVAKTYGPYFGARGRTDGAPYDQDGVYSFYFRPGKNLLIDAEGNDWGSLPVTEEEYPGVYVIEEEDYQEITTNAMAEWANGNGYDSITVENVDDGGFTTVDVIFNPKQDAKSADPVTYDDAGNVILLSQRFNTENDDIRYSLKREKEVGIAYDAKTESVNPQYSLKTWKASSYVKKKHAAPMSVRDAQGKTSETLGGYASDGSVHEKYENINGTGMNSSKKTVTDVHMSLKRKFSRN